METNSSVFGTVPTLNYASFGSRLVALIIDGIIIGIPLNIILSLLGLGASAGLSQTNFSAANFGAIIAAFSGVIFISLIVNVLYFAYFESSTSQASLGKRAMGIKVVNLNGERISFANSLGRTAFKLFVSGNICLIGYIMAAFTEKKQGLHDMVASTLVVKSK